MHVIYVGYWYDKDLRSVKELLARCPTLYAYPAALVAAGAEVTVVQRFAQAMNITRNGVHFRFVADQCRPDLRWQIPMRLHRVVRSLCAGSRNAIVHLNGLIFPMQAWALRSQLRDTAIVIQHHAERPWGGARRRIQALGLRAADAFLFASAGLANEWSSLGMISGQQPIFEVMESPPAIDIHAPHPKPANQGPRLLWVGRLTREKDPLTVLAAFEQVLQHAPEARLEMIFQGGELVAAVKDRVADSISLRGRVGLMGEVAHRNISDFYRSADLFLLGSHREGSGYALSEAMAHGLVPVVTRIPAFERMTAGAGRLWSSGDVEDCAKGILQAIQAPLEPQRAAAVASYLQYMSKEAIGARAIAAYRHTMERKAKP